MDPHHPVPLEARSRDPATALDRAAVLRAVRAGARETLPVVLAYVPFGLALGAALASTGVHPAVAWSSSALMFGGAAQLVAVDLLDAGAAAAVVVATALVVNLRHLLYSASLAPHCRDWPTGWRWAGSHLLADPVYALTIVRFQRDDRGGDREARLGYYLGVGLVCFTAWQLITGAGVLAAGALPAELPVEMAAPLTFLLLLLPALEGRGSYAAAAVGGLTALAAAGLPLGLGLLAGAAAGVTAGALAGGSDA